MTHDMASEKSPRLLQTLLMMTEGMWSSTAWWWRWLLLLTLAALSTRMVGLHNPPGTSWDEVHFGGFGNQYINRTFFHDVHPPLGKMLVAAAMRLTGYQASFPFTVGTLYPASFHYAAVRAMFGVVGAALVPLSFLTVWELTRSLPAAFLAGVALLTDHFLHRICTLLLLDGPLLLAILASIYCSFGFHGTDSKPFSPRWWLRLAATGVWLGLVMSIKYIGAFTVVFVGMHTVYQLFVVMMHPRTPLWHVIPHTAARAVCLIALPALLYLAAFTLHFAVLTKWELNVGGFYHTRFTAAFDGTEFDDRFFPKHLDYGANVSLKSNTAMGGYLESWFDLFPSEFTAPCQQVTLSPVKDVESLTWTIRFVNTSAGQVEDPYTSARQLGLRRVVRNGDHVVLTHVTTGRSLRAHGHRAPITRRHFQACGYGDDGEAGPFETWQVLVPGMDEGVPMEALAHDFHLFNYQMKCYLANPDNTPLPKSWAYESSKEVTCNKNSQASGLLWHISWVNQTRLPLTRTARQYAMGLWQRIVYQHEAMILGNSGLKATEEELSDSARPWMWPLMYRLQILSSYNTDDVAEHNNLTTSNDSDISERADGGNISTSLSEAFTSTGNKENKVNLGSAMSSKSVRSKKDDVEDRPEENNSTVYPNNAPIRSSPEIKLVDKKSANRSSVDVYAVFMNNPVLAYTNLASFVAVLVLLLQHGYAACRGLAEEQHARERRGRTLYACCWLLLCWALHYLPFFAMSRILYTHHYCPAYCYSCMLSGTVLSHVCVSLSFRCIPHLRELVLTVLLLLPTTLLLVSYGLFFPLATSIQGRLGYPDSSIKPFLDHLHFGQQWYEFGYYFDARNRAIMTELAAYDKNNFLNPDVNATLYYSTDLPSGPVDHPDIRPVAASNYTSWKRDTSLHEKGVEIKINTNGESENNKIFGKGLEIGGSSVEKEKNVLTDSAGIGKLNSRMDAKTERQFHSQTKAEL